MPSSKSRRQAIRHLLVGGTLLSAAPLSSCLGATEQDTARVAALKGRIRHSVCRWCFSSLSVEELCKAVKDIGFSAIDLVGPKDWPTLQKYGIDSSMCNGAEISLTEGWAHPEHHEQLIRNYSEMIPLVAKNGYRNLICFSGNRKGADDETGLKHAADGLKKIMPLAEKHKVTIVMELLNSKVDHKDYFCDRTPWGVELVKRVGSDQFRLLYDIYHMQIDEGDVIRTIRDHIPYIAHFHTAGVPGRNEIDESQELYYPAIMKAIADTGFKGYVAQEFIPKAADKLASLRKAIEVCDI